MALLRKTILFALIAGSIVLAGSPALAELRDNNGDAAASPNESIGPNVSTNWSGYVADTAVYTEVGGSWTVPSPRPVPDIPLASDATWVGIGGVSSRDLIQAGTEALVQDGSIIYQAWYELLPDDQHIIPIAVLGGDSVTVSLQELRPDLWHLSFKNNTTGAAYEKDLSYASSESSAEWVEEAPVTRTRRGTALVPLDDFGSILFTGAYAVADGARETAQETGAQSLTLTTDDLEPLATPAALLGDSFTITRTGAPASELASHRTASVPDSSEKEWHRTFGESRYFVLQISL